MGPAVCSGLKAKFRGEVACQGVGGAYSAGLMDNVSIKGTSEGAIREATKHFTTASTKCANTVIVAGGYRFVTNLYTPKRHETNQSPQPRHCSHRERHLGTVCRNQAEDCRSRSFRIHEEWANEKLNPQLPKGESQGSLPH
jgi:hypothetical protein